MQVIIMCSHVCDLKSECSSYSLIQKQLCTVQDQNFDWFHLANNLMANLLFLFMFHKRCKRTEKE